MPDNRGTAAIEAFAAVKAFRPTVHAVAPVVIAVAVAFTIAGPTNIYADSHSPNPSTNINIFC